MDIFYVDLVLLVILCVLTIIMCGYGFYCVYRLVLALRSRMPILLRPTQVLYTLQKEGQNQEELRTVVAYQNPFTGDYCVHKSRPSQGYINALPTSSPDSGLSDEYEPLSLEPQTAQPTRDLDRIAGSSRMDKQYVEYLKPREYAQKLPQDDNSVNKTWNWNYKEYQI